MRVLVLGGDGYLGWPTALHLSDAGHEVAVADNFVRRQYDHEMGVDSLVPITSLQTRTQAWAELSGKRIRATCGDLTDAEFTHNRERGVIRVIRRSRAVRCSRRSSRRRTPSGAAATLLACSGGETAGSQQDVTLADLRKPAYFYQGDHLGEVVTVTAAVAEVRSETGSAAVRKPHRGPLTRTQPDAGRTTAS